VGLGKVQGARRVALLGQQIWREKHQRLASRHIWCKVSFSLQRCLPAWSYCYVLGTAIQAKISALFQGESRSRLIRSEGPKARYLLCHAIPLPKFSFFSSSSFLFSNISPPNISRFLPRDVGVHRYIILVVARGDHAASLRRPKAFEL
jgi:hypothetical protein